MGFGIQAQRLLGEHLARIEDRLDRLEGKTPGSYVPAPVVFDVKPPRGNPNIAYNAHHRGGGAWTIQKDGIEMSQLTGVRLSKDEALAGVVKLDHGEALTF